MHNDNNCNCHCGYDCKDGFDHGYGYGYGYYPGNCSFSESDGTIFGWIFLAFGILMLLGVMLS